MSKLRYAVHAYAWTTSWSNATLDLIDHAKALGFDLIEIPLMEIDKVDPVAIKQRLQAGSGSRMQLFQRFNLGEDALILFVQESD